MTAFDLITSSIPDCHPAVQDIMSQLPEDTVACYRKASTVNAQSDFFVASIYESPVKLRSLNVPPPRAMLRQRRPELHPSR